MLIGSQSVIPESEQMSLCDENHLELIFVQYYYVLVGATSVTCIYVNTLLSSKARNGLILYILTSVCVFFILFSRHFLRC